MADHEDANQPHRRVEWGVEQDLPPGGPGARRHVRIMESEDEARAIAAGAVRLPVQTNPVLMRRDVTVGPWRPADT